MKNSSKKLLNKKGFYDIPLEGMNVILDDLGFDINDKNLLLLEPGGIENAKLLRERGANVVIYSSDLVIRKLLKREGFDVKDIDVLLEDTSIVIDRILVNPPYNTGLLDRKNSPICNHPNDLIKNAAKTRIDAAFFVKCAEQLLAPDGEMVFLWPWAWSEFSSWSNFRKWLNKKKCLRSITEVDPHLFQKDGSKAAVGVYLTHFVNSGTEEVITRNSLIKEESYSYTALDGDREHWKFRGLTGRAIHRKCLENADVPRIQLIKKEDLQGDFASVSSAYDARDPAKFGRLVFSHLTYNGDKWAGIQVENEKHFDILNKWWNSKLFNFLGYQIKGDFHNTKTNLGSVPNVCQFVKDQCSGIFEITKIYEYFNLSKKEIDFVETKTEIKNIKI